MSAHLNKLVPPEMAESIKGDLLILLLHKLGGQISFSVGELDVLPAGHGIIMEVNQQDMMFHMRITAMKGVVADDGRPVVPGAS